MGISWKQVLIHVAKQALSDFKPKWRALNRSNIIKFMMRILGLVRFSTTQSPSRVSGLAICGMSKLPFKRCDAFSSVINPLKSTAEALPCLWAM